MSHFHKHKADHFLLLIVVGLTSFGFVMVSSASSVVAERFHEDANFFVQHQILYGGTVGLALFLLGFLLPYRYWRALALPALLLALGLLVLVFVPGLQVAYGGAARWIGLGPITIQPTEIVKLAFILYLAALLEKKGEDIGDFRKSVVPFLIITAVISVLIILQPDIGTLFTTAAIASAMVFTAGFRLRHLFLIGLGGLSLFAVLLNTARYRLERIMVYLHPELDPQGIGYQINQALLAVGTGGIWGLGLGRSRQKYYYLPEPAGDSIFAIIAEELGFARSVLLLLAFVVIGWRGFLIARRAPDVFGRLLACGITSWILIQAFINMGSILGVMPLTGIPLPFISYGGTALATILFASGVLLNISKYTVE
ncbi:MAG: putative lipid II flippase FtsW [bacterium]